MLIFFLILGYILLLSISTLFIIKTCDYIKAIRLHKFLIDNIDKSLYIQLREIQFKSRNIGKLAEKLLKQKKSFLTDMFSNIVIALLPFKKLKTILLLRKLLKNLS